ncbi:TlpA disulfide reductase family protein [Gaetbulibacter sp. M235]|uniref:peroxiredoxin family protein n=1 Tax=Gaetbulibacter sp. M235 TaxID=3126510 RepID=UPI00374F15CD
MKNTFILVVVLIFCSCKEVPEALQLGTYRATLKVNDTLDLPFNFEVTSSTSLKIFNADEIISVEDITYENDSVKIQMPVFEGYIKAKISKNMLNGSFIKESLNRIVPFKAEFNKENRFEVANETPQYDVSGNWETVFSQGIEEDEYAAKGIFKQTGNVVTGTFRTTTGDYRYLDGVMDGNILKLSAFDGSHAFLFVAIVKDSTMEGIFYSGNHFKEPFVAKRNATFELPDENELTFLKEGYDRIDFTFPDADGKMVSLNDDEFKNKVVVLQIMGTWCPNCLDESKFYSEYYKNNKNKGVEFIGLAFEYVKSPEAAFKNISRLKEHVGINYPVLLAQYGSTNKKLAQEKLPMLNHVLSYPTSIIIDKTGKVRKIHTGFNGPATGEKYIEFKNEFDSFINVLLNE